MKQFAHRLPVRTQGKGLYEFTEPVAAWVRECRIQTGILTLFVQHTSASLIIQENADPDVVRDLSIFFERMVPENAGWYKHTLEGPDDMPAHIRAALTSVQLSIPVLDGEIALGPWQGIYLFEHRTRTHKRTVILHLIGK